MFRGRGGSVTLPAEHPLAPEGRRNVATGRVRRSRAEPVVSGNTSQPAPAGRRIVPISRFLRPAGAGIVLSLAHHGFRSPLANSTRGYNPPPRRGGVP